MGINKNIEMTPMLFIALAVTGLMLLVMFSNTSSEIKDDCPCTRNHFKYATKDMIPKKKENTSVITTKSGMMMRREDYDTEDQF